MSPQILFPCEIRLVVGIVTEKSDLLVCRFNMIFEVAFPCILRLVVEVITDKFNSFVNGFDMTDEVVFVYEVRLVVGEIANKFDSFVAVKVGLEGFRIEMQKANQEVGWGVMGKVRGSCLPAIT